MIVDCYTHVWDAPDMLGRALPGPTDVIIDGTGTICPDDGPLRAGVHRHQTACAPVDRVFVLGFKSARLEADIPNARVAEYVARDPDRLIGFAGIDPSHPKAAIEDVRRAQEDWSLRGIAVSPTAQDVHPSDSQSMLVYAAAAERHMPVLFHPGICTVPRTPLAYAQPLLLDEVARELPDLRIIIAHMGYPWVRETAWLLGKHEHVFAEISLTVLRPWRGYQALMTAHESGVTDKLLFGSGFPFAGASETIEAVYSINTICQGTGLPTIPRETLRAIVERDALTALGMQHAPPARRVSSDP